MANEKHVTTSQLRDDLSPAASPLGTDDEAGDTTPSADRVEMARNSLLPTVVDSIDGFARQRSRSRPRSSSRSSTR